MKIHHNEFNGEGVDHNTKSISVLTAPFNATCFEKTIDQFGAEEAYKVAVQTFVTTDEFVADLRSGMGPRFLSQNTAQKEPKKKMPLTAANAIICSKKLVLVGTHHLRAQLALHWTHGSVFVGAKQVQFLHWILDVRLDETGSHPS